MDEKLKELEERIEYIEKILDFLKITMKKAGLISVECFEKEKNSKWKKIKP